MQNNNSLLKQVCIDDDGGGGVYDIEYSEWSCTNCMYRRQKDQLVKIKWIQFKDVIDSERKT